MTRVAIRELTGMGHCKLITIDGHEVNGVQNVHVDLVIGKAATVTLTIRADELEVTPAKRKIELK